MSARPKNWPSHLPYLHKPLHSPSLTPSHLLALRTPPPPSSTPIIPASHKSGPSPTVLITSITNPSHPANGQHGLFATRDLAPSELIVIYHGEIHAGTGAGAERHKTSDYDLWIDKEGDLAVDAARQGNEGRFCNDFRGVPEDGGDGRGKGSKREKGDWKEGKKRGPNAEFREVWDERFKEKGMAVFVLPARKKAVGRERDVGIRKGEEVLVSYGKGFWGGRREEGEGGVEGEPRVEGERGVEGKGGDGTET